MNPNLSGHLRSWEHCPDCGALLLSAPGALYCAHCGFEEAVFDEPLCLVTRLCGKAPSALEAEEDFEPAPAPLSEAA